jgi:acyl-CoA synthetase (AMP-forming)/AMP-acid ligase II
MIISTVELIDKVKEQAGKLANMALSFTDLKVIPSDAIDDSGADRWEQPAIDGETVAYYQHTSGSTGAPKAVQVSHSNVLQNCEAIQDGFSHSPDTIMLSWLPIYHDMGLVGGVMQPIYYGGSCYLMSPVELVTSPIDWLKAITKFKATTSGGPNFAYDLLCHKVSPEEMEKLDLSSWNVAFSGAETVRAETMELFAQTFSNYGFKYRSFYPCYGMAEATLFVTGGLRGGDPIVKYVDRLALEQNEVVEIERGAKNSKAIVGCGRAWSDTEIRIVNPDTQIECEPGKIGEVWVKSSGVSRGYRNQPEANEATFNGRIQPDGLGPYLRTGDMGFMDDLELFITGRIKEIMIIWGRNQYPQQIEATVQASHPALRLNAGAAFSLEIDGEEKLVVVQEVERTSRKDFNFEEIVGSVRMAIGEEYLIEIYGFILIKTASIPKTTSGKIQRTKCKQMYLNGELEIIAEWTQGKEQAQDITNLTDYSAPDL